MMFDSFEGYDVQETRRVSEAIGEKRGVAKEIIKQASKKIAKNYSVPEIADMLEQDVALIQRIYDVISTHPNRNVDEIWSLLGMGQEESATSEHVN